MNNPYKLSTDENARIFRELILPDYMEDCVESKSPTAVFLGGQPGAGKCCLMLIAEKMFESEGCVIINADELRPYNRNYKSLAASGTPEDATRFTGEDAGLWVRELIREAKRRKTNIIVDGTLRDTQAVAASMHDLQTAGYKIEARILAVNERISHLSTRMRYEKMYLYGGIPRATRQDAHDAGVRGVLDTVDYLENNNIPDSIIVSTRDAKRLYENHKVDGILKQNSRASTAIETERVRPRTDLEIEQHDSDWKSVITKMTDRNAPRSEIDSAEHQHRDDIRCFNDASGAHMTHTGAPPESRSFNNRW